MPRRAARARARRAQDFDGSGKVAPIAQQLAQTDVSSALPQERDYQERILQELAASGPAVRLLQSMVSRSLPDNQLSCTLAHELRQPLFTIAMANENLRLLIESETPDRAMMRQSVKRIDEQVQRAQAIIDQTLSRASGGTQAREAGDLAAAAQRAAQLLDSMPAARRVAFAWQLPHERLLVGVTQLELEQVFVNLLRNAMESIADRRKEGWEGQGCIIVTIERCANEVRCVVTDDGAGLAPATDTGLFQPFFTTKSNGGTGLGLHICREIVTRAGGMIDVQPGQSEGAQVEIRLPLLSESSS